MPGSPKSSAEWGGASTSESSIDGGSGEPPLDLVHLARQCQGDGELEAELLGLFRLQSRALTAELSHASGLSAERRAHIAHRLRGSALAVGARRVARAAAALEEKPPSFMGAEAAAEQSAAAAQAVAALEASVDEAIAEIERIRG